jgi:hypothetical protein
MCLIGHFIRIPCDHKAFAIFKYTDNKDLRCNVLGRWCPGGDVQEWIVHWACKDCVRVEMGRIEKVRRKGEGE